MSEADASRPCFAPVANYYGTPYVVLREGSPVIGIEDSEGRMERPISEAFHEAWLREFGEAEGDPDARTTRGEA